MSYAIWLFALSVPFLLLERLWPRRRMPLLRRGFWNDVFYIVFNSHGLSYLVGYGAIHAIAALDKALDLTHLKEWVYLGAMSGKPFWLQLVVLLIAMDFAQWCVHNLLHRVGWLWQFHKVHHSIVDLDWIGNWRIHWGEIVVYRVLLYVPAAFFGFAPVAMFWYGVVNTLIGHFAHANLRWKIGPLKYIVNSPELHVWHHTHPDSGPPNRNFALTLSVWDWLFRTWYLPGRDPERLGFTGIESYPGSVPGQWLEPFRRRAATGAPGS
jgi:sterol desaturase/sphingolipid hydroxylase (fatty acid hydroxylase superfamily)